MPFRFTAATLATVLALTACAKTGTPTTTPPLEESPLVPTFPPDPEEQDDGAPDEDHADNQPAPADHHEDSAPSKTVPSEQGRQQATEPGADEDQAAQDRDETVSAATTEPTVRSSVTDPRDDTPPRCWAAPTTGPTWWRGRSSGPAPATSRSPSSWPSRPDASGSGTPMNVASFHDLTGDGRIDLEVWSNWSEDGWFASWRDNREGRAAYGDEAGITLDHRGATLEAVVPAERFTDAAAWRWSLRLVSGRYEWLGTSDAAHDLAPDDGFVAHRG